MNTVTICHTEDLEKAVRILRDGGMSAVPTETVYGLCVNGLDAAAIEDLYEVKGRPEKKPLSLMVASPEEICRFARNVPPAAEKLAARFWPGPLTLILPARDHLPSVLLAGGNTVGLRCPDHPLTLTLLKMLPFPLAGPSANPSGSPSAKTAEDVLRYFDGKIGAVIDGGPCGLGRESTILDMSHIPYRVLREGGLPFRDLDEALRETLTVIGVTGGTGSGKTSVTDYLREKGFLSLDCDKIYHELLETSEPMLCDLRDRFPFAFESGQFDRKALGSRVFTDPDALAELTELTNRYVREEVLRRLSEWAWSGGTYAVIDAIGLLESGLGDLCRVTVAVTASADVRLQRIMSREGITKEYALSRIRAQKEDSWFETHCDLTLHNDGSLAELRTACSELLDPYLPSGAANENK